MKRLCALVGVTLLGWLATAAHAQSERLEVPLAPGLEYLRITRPGPVVAHLLRADLAEPTLRPTVALAGDQILDVEPLSEIIAGRSGVTVAGAINGGHAITAPDLYRGSPIGLLIADGELLCDPWPVQRSAILFNAEGRPRIEALGLRGRISGPDGKVQRLGGLNRRPLPGELVLYSPRFNPATRVAEPGQQIVLRGVFGEDGKLRAGTAYTGRVEAVVDGQVNIEIPRDGVVITGSGPAASWLAGRQLGETIGFEFELAQEFGEITAALGAGPRLVRDGELSVEAEQEKMGISRQTGRQPRSAIGFNERYLFCVAVDGRNPELSIGIGLEDLGRLLIELGCTQAMELDGGGATTLYARDRVVNQPSDGRPRPLASALLLLTEGQLSNEPLPGPGGTLAGGGTAPLPAPETPLPAPQPQPQPRPFDAEEVKRLRFEPAELSLPMGRITPLVVKAETAEGELTAPADMLAFAVAPAALGTVDEQGRFTALKAGIGRLTATLGEATAVMVIKISRADVPELPAPGGTAPQPDLTGDPTPVAPPTTVPDPTGDNPTRPTAPPTRPPTAPSPPQTVSVPPEAKGYQRPEVDLPEGERRGIDGFEQARHWSGKGYPQAVEAGFTVVDQNIRLQGDRCGRLEYDFSATREPRAAYAIYNKIVGFPKAVSVYVFGDGNGNTLRGQFRDKNNTLHTVEFMKYINWDHQWRRVTALIPAGVEGPLRWESIYLVQTQPRVQNAGVIFLDQLEGIY